MLGGILERNCAQLPEEVVMRRFLCLAILTIGVALPGFAPASTWQIDPAHSSTQFAVRHLMVSTVRGTLGKVTGAVIIDTEDVSKSSVDATIDVTALDTKEPKRDEHLRSPDFFDAAKYP